MIYKERMIDIEKDRAGLNEINRELILSLMSKDSKEENFFTELRQDTDYIFYTLSLKPYPSKKNTLKKTTCSTKGKKKNIVAEKTEDEKKKGGQLLALAVSVAETAADLANGLLSWGEAGLNLLTSAVSAGASWLGDIAGKAVEGVVKGVKYIGGAVVNMTKAAVNGIGNIINSGFRLKGGKIDWAMNEEKWSSSISSYGEGILMSGAGAIAGEAMGNVTSDKNIIGIASSMGSESVNYALNGEFNVSIANLGSLMDRGDGASWGEGFMGQLGRNMYLKDRDIAGVRGLGLGVTFSRGKAPKWKSSGVMGGMDITGVTGGWAASGISAVGRATGMDKVYKKASAASYGMFRKINKGLKSIGKAVVNVGKGIWGGIKAVGNFVVDAGRSIAEGIGEAAAKAWAGIMPMSIPENDSMPKTSGNEAVATGRGKRRRKEGEGEESELESTYKIGKGDTLSEIAEDVAEKLSKKLGKKVSMKDAMKALKAMNGIDNIHDIQAGANLVLPNKLEDIAKAGNTDISERYEESKAGRRANAEQGIYEGTFAGITDSEKYYAAQRSFRQNPKLIPGTKEYDPKFARQVKEQMGKGYGNYEEGGITKAIKGFVKGVKSTFKTVDKGAATVNYTISSAVIWAENTMIEGISEIGEAVSTTYDWADEYIPMDAAMLYTGTSEFQAAAKSLSVFNTYTKTTIDSSRFMTSYKTSKVMKKLMQNGMTKKSARDYILRRQAQVDTTMPFEIRRNLLGGRIFPDKDRIAELLENIK